MKWLFLICLSSFFYRAQSQNLIPNGGFEANDYGQVRNWIQPTDNYYHYENRQLLQDSLMGYNAVNGICLLQPEASEFLLIQLKRPLTKNQVYRVSFTIESSNTYIGKKSYLNSIEMVFSDTPILVTQRTKLLLNPSLIFPIKVQDEIFTQPEPIQFKANGTERYLIMGKFHNNTQLLFEAKRNAIWQQQYQSGDSIKKYYAKRYPKINAATSKRDIKRETKLLKDSLEKLDQAKIAALHANAAYYQQKVSSLSSEVDSTFHIRVYLDDVCIAPVLEDGSCNCEWENSQTFNPGQTYKLTNIKFDLDKSIFKPESYNEMNYLVTILNQYPKMQIQINGHTDSLNNDEYNIALSQRRAKAVYNYVITKGISASRLKYKGFGEQVPVTSNTTEEGRTLNRRVEFLVLKLE